MTFQALNLDRRVAGHAATAVKAYSRLMDRHGFKCPPEILAGLQDLEHFLTEVGQSGPMQDESGITSQSVSYVGGNELLTQTKAAKVAGVAPRTLRRWMDAGHLPYRQVGKARRINRNELEHFLAGREEGA